MATARKKAPSKRKAPGKKRAPAKRGRGKKNVVTVDFTDVESGGGIPTPDGYYVAAIKGAEQDVSQAGNDMIALRWKIDGLGGTVFDNWSLLPQSLWVLRTALECMGYDIPDGDYDLDVDALIGEKCGLEITNEEYEEEDRPRVTGYMPVEAAEQLMGEAGGTAAEEEEEEGEPEEEEEEEEEQEEEEEEEETAPPPKKKGRKKAPAKKKKAAALRPGARVTFEGDDGEEMAGVIEYVEDDSATVVDDEEGEWEIPLSDLTKA